MRKTLFVSSFLAGGLLAAAAFAGPFGLPDHQQNGWRDTGCAEAANVDKGGYLNNPTCKAPRSLKNITVAGLDGVLGTADDQTVSVSDN